MIRRRVSAAIAASAMATWKIVTEMAYIRVTQTGLVLEEMAPGLSFDDVQRATEAPLIASRHISTMEY